MSQLKFPIYLDHHATTPVDPRVLDEMMPYFTENFGNAASLDHPYGYDASVAVQKSRESIPDILLLDTKFKNEWENLWKNFSDSYKDFLIKNNFGDRIWCEVSKNN